MGRLAATPVEPGQTALVGPEQRWDSPPPPGVPAACLIRHQIPAPRLAATPARPTAVRVDGGAGRSVSGVPGRATGATGAGRFDAAPCG